MFITIKKVPGITALIKSEPKKFEKYAKVNESQTKQERKGRIFKAKFKSKLFKYFFKANLNSLNTFDEWFPSRIINI